MLTSRLEDIVKTHIFTRLPFAFSKRPAAMETLTRHLHERLGVRTENIVVIGSAKIGFSLSPDNFPRAFTGSSDIDVLLVDSVMFDSVWGTLLSWHYPRRFLLDGGDWEWVKRRRDEVYWGWLEPSKIKYLGLTLPDALRPMRDLSAEWFGAFRSLGRFPELMGRDVSGRLYRTWEHALAYQVAALGQIKTLIQREETQ